MSRSPTPWLLGDIPHDRISAPAIGHPRPRLNQLQPGGCTQLHHLNEAMPFRTAGPSDLLELEPSAGTHLPPTITHAFGWHVQTSSSPRATLGRKWLSPGAEGLQRSMQRSYYAIAGIAANEWRDISAAAFCCEALSRSPVNTTS